MKVLIFTDNHFCLTHSIVVGMGTKFSIRLENQIKTIEWIEEVARNNGCELEFCLGDFFDKPSLCAEEITALNQIKWNKDIKHIFLVGNHESPNHTLSVSSTNALLKNIDELRNQFEVISSAPSSILLGKTQIHFVPYMIERDRLALKELMDKDSKATKHVILSHNDIKGIMYGAIETKTGFTLDEINSECDLYLNGHIHTHQKIGNKIVNIGNCTGLNFTEDAYISNHYVMILDTETLEYELIENPYAFNFYRVDINSVAEINKLSKLKSGAVISVRCPYDIVTDVSSAVDGMRDKIVAKKITATHRFKDDEGDTEHVDLHVDYFEKLFEFCVDTIGRSDVLLEELSEIREGGVSE